MFDGRGNPSIRLTKEATTMLLMEFSQHTYLILSYINVNNSRSWNKKLSSLRCAKVNFLDSHRRAWPTKTQAPDSGWQRRAWKATRRTCLAATCKLRKGKSLTSLPSSARQQPREVQALWFPQPISLSTPPPRRNEIRPHFDQAAPERSQQTPIYLGKIGRQAPRGCELTFRLVSQVHTSVPLPSEVAAGVCGGVVLVVKPPRSSIKTENYKVPFGNSARTTREPEPFFASTRARQRSVPGAALSLPFRTVHLNGFQASAVSAIQGPRQSG